MLDNPIGCGTRKQKTLMGNEQARTRSRFFESKTLTSKSFCSLDYARGSESILLIYARQ